MDAIPIWVLLAATIVVVMAAVEGGHHLGRRMKRRADEEKVTPVSSVLASTLGLLAFMLAFTFGLVTSRYDARKALVRTEANSIRTVWLRTDFLPEPDRGEAAALVRAYLGERLRVFQVRDISAADKAIARSSRIQHRLWDLVAANVRKDLDSPVATLYVDPLNQMFDLQALRVVVALEARVPTTIWVALYALILLGMILVGYQTAIAESARRSPAPLILALSFSVVIALIVSLDRPFSEFIKVSQQPLEDVRAWMDAGAVAEAGPGPRP
jgi:hypothetical protein